MRAPSRGCCPGNRRAVLLPGRTRPTSNADSARNGRCHRSGSVPLSQFPASSRVMSGFSARSWCATGTPSRGHADIEFQFVDAECDGALERRQRVFGQQPARAAVALDFHGPDRHRQRAGQGGAQHQDARMSQSRSGLIRHAGFRSRERTGECDRPGHPIPTVRALFTIAQRTAHRGGGAKRFDGIGRKPGTAG